MKKLTEDQINQHLQELKGWTLKNGFIQKEFKFKDFKETFSIMTRIAFECEQMNHHPNWENVYNNLIIRLNTHDVGGITQHDINLAKSIEAIVES